MTNIKANNEYVKNCIRNGVCVPVVGAGASIAAGGESWHEYIDLLKKNIDHDVLSDLKLDQLSNEPDRAEALLKIREQLVLQNISPSEGQPGAIHEALASWSCPVYITTNFDDRLESAIKREHGKCEVFNLSNINGFDFKFCQKAPVVLKLCTSNNGDTAGAISFAELVYRERDALEILLTFIRTRTLVFVGCGMQAPLLRAALDYAAVSKIQSGQHLALMVGECGKAQSLILEKRGVFVDQVKFDSTRDITKNTLAKIESLSPWDPRAKKNILVFEPASDANLKKIISVSERNKSIKRIGVVTENKVLAKKIERMGESNNLVVIKVDDISAVDSNLHEIGSINWHAIIVLHEYATYHAACFCENIQFTNLNFHNPIIAKKSRNKEEFRKHIKNKLQNNSVIKHIPYETICLRNRLDLATLLETIRKKSETIGSSRLIIKPIDAAGSSGVYSINLDQKDEDITPKITALLEALSELQTHRNTSHCITDKLIELFF